MRLLLAIAAILLFAEYSNLIPLCNITEVDIVLCDESESEEEKKTEKEAKKFKLDKHSYFDDLKLLTFFTQQKKHPHKPGLCLKGHCVLIDQPPEA